MQMVEFVGLSGPIKFDTLGLRTNFEMDLMELQLDGLVSSDDKASILNEKFRLKLEPGTVLITSTLPG